LKGLSTQGEGPVYLAALSGTKKPWAIKTMALQKPGAVDLASLKAEVRILARMHSAHLTGVVESTAIESDGGFVMEYVPGKSLAEICARAEEYAVLLPPELGLVVAHDTFAALDFFHAFEGGGRIHGNISPRTILVGYAGHVKVAGYRPGSHPMSGVDAQVARDLKPLATILCDLPFEKFPKELANLVPRLLEDNVSAVEAMAAARAFLHECVPSADHRRKVAEWLKDIFMGQCEEEAQEEGRLLSAGMQLLAPSSVRPVAKRVSMIGGTTALLVLVGGGALFVAHRRPSQAHSEAMPAMPKVVPGQFSSAGPSPPEPAGPALTAALPVAPADPAPISVSRPRPPSDTADNHSTRREAEVSSPDRLLHAADAAFSDGKRIEAVNLAVQALNAGGGTRAHLALGEYYRSMHRYQEAMNHYRAVVESEPQNNLALTGVKMLEKKLSPCQ
jgi:tetratricopeptide (TPR) repeat protein